jgi:8-oxo-dGTP pyrophosphatase MutT (NUDIX family)
MARGKLVREFSAGGVVLRRKTGAWWVAIIEPHHREDTLPDPGKKRKVTLCLPKGIIDPGEKPPEAALREVREETGITAKLVAKLSDSKYAYVRNWGDGARVFKVVSFFLMRYESGRIDNVSDNMRNEVRRAFWMPLDEAPKKLSYGGERQVTRRALRYLELHNEI